MHASEVPVLFRGIISGAGTLLQPRRLQLTPRPNPGAASPCRAGSPDVSTSALSPAWSAGLKPFYLLAALGSAVVGWVLLTAASAPCIPPPPALAAGGLILVFKEWWNVVRINRRGCDRCEMIMGLSAPSHPWRCQALAGLAALGSPNVGWVLLTAASAPCISPSPALAAGGLISVFKEWWNVVRINRRGCDRGEMIMGVSAPSQPWRCQALAGLAALGSANAGWVLLTAASAPCLPPPPALAAGGLILVFNERWNVVRMNRRGCNRGKMIMGLSAPSHPWRWQREGSSS